jgi:hypothetical protein
MQKILWVLGLSLIVYGLSGSALAQSLQSPGYRMDDSYIGPGGTVGSSSPSYRENSTAGDIGVGASSSATYSQVAGVNTTNDPRLVLVVNTSAVNLGQFSNATTTTATATFKVLDYTSYGYSVFVVGATPKTGTHNLTGMTPTAASQVGAEQFGINLKANTSPVTFGADELQVPTTFSFGAAATGYNIRDNFRYVNGEKIAGSTKSSGETDYTISYIVNTALTTPGGTYTGSQSLIVVGSY